MIELYRIEKNNWFILPCPKCGKKNKIGLLKFLDAINQENPIMCFACHADIYIKVTCQTRSAELRNEAVRAGADESRMTYSCPKCFFPRMRYDNLVQECPHCGDAKFQAPG